MIEQVEIFVHCSEGTHAMKNHVAPRDKVFERTYDKEWELCSVIWGREQGNRNWLSIRWYQDAGTML